MLPQIATVLMAAAGSHAITGIQAGLLHHAIANDNVPLFNRCHAALWRKERDAVLADAIASKIERAKPNVQHSMLCSVVDPGLASKIVPQLRRIAGDQQLDASNRRMAVGAIGRSKATDLRTRLVLYACLRETWTPLRCEACLALWAIEKDPQSIVPTLQDLLKQDSVRSRKAAIEVIGEIGPALKSHFDVVELMNSGDPSIRMAVYPLLPEFASSKKVACEELAKAVLNSSGEYANFVSDYQSGKLGIPLDQFVFASKELGREVSVANHALARIGAEAIPEIVKMMQMKDRAHARLAALNSLRSMQSANKRGDALKAVPEIEKLLNDPDPAVKALAETTLKELCEKK